MKYEELAASAFFTWFGVKQTGKLRGSVVTCKPGGYQQYVDLRFGIDRDQRVIQAELILDRSWLEAFRTAPFAADIAQSFVVTFAGEDRASQVLGEQLEQLMGNSPGVLSLDHTRDPVPPDLRVVVSPALDVYAGRAMRAELLSPLHRLILSNDGAPEGKRLSITWIAAPSDGQNRVTDAFLDRVRRLFRG